MKKNDKTNVMRILDAAKIPHLCHYYDGDGTMTGEDIAKMLNQNPDHVFKTLVTIGKSKQNYVFVVPVAKELNLKKAAAAVGEKSIEMVKSKELLPLTGYIHGGCSPIGMKKFFPTVIDKSCDNFDTIMFSAGKIGYQVELSADSLRKVIEFSTYELT